MQSILHRPIQDFVTFVFAMRSSLGLLPLFGGLASLSEAKPLNQPSVTFVSPSQASPSSAQNVVVEYSGDVDGELTITYGSCDSDAVISAAKQRIGATHVGSHPLAERHLDHEDKRPTKFVWLTPSDVSGGCLRAFLDDELVGQSDELLVTKRLSRRAEKKKAFADVAGDDSMWFNGVAYLEQKQPEETFVASAKNKTFGILGGGISGLMSSVSQLCCSCKTFLEADSIFFCTAVARLRGYSQLENLGVFGARWWSHQDGVPERHLSRGRPVS